MKKGFRQKLKERQEYTSSLVCVGLDPLPDKLPKSSRLSKGSVTEDIFIWMKRIIDKTAPYACMFKPQIAHYEAIPGGVNALSRIIAHIKADHPDIPVFLDCKRGDIGRTQQRYQIANFDLLQVDGMNFSPYMGKDCMEFLVNKEHLERAIVGLAYTSNESGRETQDAVLKDGRLYWEFIVENTLRWAEELGIVENAGLVMAAAYEKPKGSNFIYSEHLRKCREIVGDKLWLLIPGIGTQKGFVAETVQASFMGNGSIAVNSSSAIIFASNGEDFAEAAAEEAKKLRDSINEAIPAGFKIKAGG